ncbi:MAG: sugar phosphate nucleotidyltransferase [Candidatus Gastranaerophilaceae bacterium]|jgi:NDP-sugar pyrophosphorylase family protein
MKIQNQNSLNPSTFVTKNAPEVKTSATPSFSGQSYLSKEANNSIVSTAKAGITFRGDADVVIEKNQSYIPNLFNITGEVSAPEKGSTNPSIKAVKDDKNGIEVFVKGKPVLKLDQKDPSNLPTAVLRAGKFDPTLEFVDPELGIKVKLLGGSKIEGKSFDLTFPGVVKTEGESSKTISFTGHGNLQVVTYHNEPATKEAVDLYNEGVFYNKVNQGDHIATISEDDPTFMVLAGGFGTRLYDFTGDKYNKPSVTLPTASGYRLMGNALDQASKAGVLDGKDDKVTYLSGADTIKGENVKKVIQDKNLGDGGCIAKAIANGSTPNDKPLIILNADTITNADITRAYKAYHDHPDAAILIPYYTAPKERASDFGLMAAKKVNENDNVLEINSFVEKPKTLEAAEPAKVPGKESYMANPGIYILSPKAVKMLGEKGKVFLNPDGAFELGLAKDFITPLVEMCNKGELQNEDGTSMKAYTVALEAKGGKSAYWDDLGRTSAVLETFRNLAAETKQHGSGSTENKFYGLPEFLLKDAANNVDLKTGVVYMSDTAKPKLEQFKEKYGITKLEGNVLISDF